MLSMTYMYIRQAHLFMVTLTIKFKHMYTCIFVKALIHSGVNMITQECLDRIMKFEYNIVNENITDEVDSGHHMTFFLHLPQYKLSGTITNV